MDNFKEMLEALDNNDLDFFGEVKVGEHGKVVGGRFEPYHDVTVYEDGHEEWDYIGD